MAPGTILLDTCVWLDYYLGSRPGSQAARTLVDAALARDVTLLYPVGSVKDVSYIVARTLKNERRASGELITEKTALADAETAWACLANMRQIATAVGADASDVWMAEELKHLHGDVGDDLVIAAVERSRADILVTDDLDLIRHAPVAAMTPGDALTLLETADRT